MYVLRVKGTAISPIKYLMSGGRPTRVVRAGVVAAALLALPATASASRPGDTEHGVNRAKLAKKAERVVEKRNAIEVKRISRCGPKKKRRRGKVRLDFSKWVCEWRAEGLWPGEVPYHCKGKARWKRKRGRWRVDGCKNQLQPMIPLLPEPGPHPSFGYNDDWARRSGTSLDLMAAAEPEIARTTLPWVSVERHRGVYDWVHVDRLYNEIVSRGIRPQWVLIDAPCWAQPDPGRCDQIRPAREHYDALANFAAAAAQRYPEAIGLEVWNEPNYPVFWGGWPEPDRYAEMLKKVADAVHAARPGLTVVSGGLSPHSDSDKEAIGFRNFLKELYERGAAQRADAIGIHPYPGVGPNEDYVGDVRVYLGKIDNVMTRYDDGATPMWATEYGVSTAGPHAFTPHHQGAALAELYLTFRRVEGLPLVVVHRFQEQPDLAGREAGFGVVGESLALKPAYCSMNQARGVPC